MKIRASRRIQKEVDKRKGSDLSSLTVLHVCGASFLNGNRDEGSDNFAYGVRNGVELFEKFLREKDGRYTSGGGHLSLPVPDDFGIYCAGQETSDGNDYLYFIGTVFEIIEKLRKVPVTSQKDDE
jgi:hypothetical protein